MKKNAIKHFFYSKSVFYFSLPKSSDVKGSIHASESHISTLNFIESHFDLGNHRY